LFACHRGAKELGEIAPLLSDHASEEDRKELRLLIGQSVYDILENVAGYVAARNPEAQAEFEARYEKYGRMV